MPSYRNLKIYHANNIGYPSCFLAAKKRKISKRIDLAKFLSLLMTIGNNVKKDLLEINYPCNFKDNSLDKNKSKWKF